MAIDAMAMVLDSSQFIRACREGPQFRQGGALDYRE